MIKVAFIFLIVLLAPYPDLRSQEVKTSYDNLEDALEHPDDVIELDLKRKHLKEWPVEMSKFKNLKKLDLSHNKINALPNDLSAFGSLEYLDLTMNKLDSLPNSIGDLASLKKLGLGNNEVYHVSPRIGQLKNLQVLEMWSNNVHYLPIEAGEMSNLMELDLRNIQMNQDHQNAIKAIFDSADLQIKFSMSCNCQ